MFDIGGVELLVIAIVLIVVVGPKDLPRMLRTFGRTTSQLRRMAGDFRRQFDDALREAELDEVKNAASSMRKLDPSADIRKAMNPMKAVGDEIRSSLNAATKPPPSRVPDKADAAQPDPTASDVTAPVTPSTGPAMEPIERGGTVAESAEREKCA